MRDGEGKQIQGGFKACSRSCVVLPQTIFYKWWGLRRGEKHDRNNQIVSSMCID